MKSTFTFLLFCGALFAVSCVEKHESDINRGVDIAAIEPMMDYEVPVKEGYTTVVTLDGEQLAVTRQPLTIPVPARAVTRSGGIEVSYSDEDIFGEYGYTAYWHYLSFEDTRNGDCDYNDVVLHGMVKSNVPWNYSGTQECKHYVAVQPVALGGTKNVGLGILYRDDAGVVQEKILTDDIRRDLYKGDPTFPINTDLSKPKKKVSNDLKLMFECTTHAATFPVVWFIINGSDRLYAASTNFQADRKFNMINKEGMPYGIALTTKWSYPVERCNIREAYPNFDEWLRTGDESVLLSNSIRQNTFYPAAIKDGPDGTLWDYDKTTIWWW